MSDVGTSVGFSCAGADTHAPRPAPRSGVAAPETSRPAPAGHTEADQVHHPAHYQTAAGIEAIDVIEAQFGSAFHLATAVKYILRHRAKGRPAEDLRKAKWYVERVASAFPSHETPRVQIVWPRLPADYLIKAADAFGLNGPAREALFRIVDAACHEYRSDRFMALRDAARLLETAANAHGRA